MDDYYLSLLSQLGDVYSSDVDADLLQSSAGIGLDEVWLLFSAAMDHNGNLFKCWRMDC